MSEFRCAVEELVAQIPSGKVISYGDVAVICGRPRASRQVGQIAHFGEPSLPWHRVVRKDGGLARGYPGGMSAQKAALEAEGVPVKNFVVQELGAYLWQL